MTFNHIARRTHLYAAMFLLPWFLIYGIGALPFNHHAFFDKIFKGSDPEWSVRFERSYRLPVPEDADLRQTGERILSDVGLQGAFGTYHPNKDRLHVYLFNFWTATELIYHIDEGRLLARDKRFRWDHFFTGAHARGGFEQSSLLNDSWAVLVDIVCVGILIWIASGIYMWWQIRHTRFWGFVTLSSGVISFLVFLLTL